MGNYPGITVDKKIGSAALGGSVRASILDLPGTYSINPTSIDENIVLNTLIDEHNQDFPDVIVVVAEIENLKRNLLLYSQIKDLRIPTILAINMADQGAKKGIEIDVEGLKQELHGEVVLVSARHNTGIKELKEAIARYDKLDRSVLAKISHRIDAEYFDKLDQDFPNWDRYKTWLCLTQLLEPPEMTSGGAADEFL